MVSMKIVLASPKNAVSSRSWILLSVLLIFFLPSLASAFRVTGRVVNRSRNQPSSGDEVVLYKVDRSMHEVARTHSRDDGTFQFDSADFPYLVAVFHQKVSYHTPTLLNADAVEIA